MADYKIRLKSPPVWTASSYTSVPSLVAEFVDFERLGYLNVVNSEGRLEMILRGDHPALSYLVDKAIIEVWRRDQEAGIDWYRDFLGIVRGIRRGYQGRAKKITVYAPGIAHILSWRTNNYHAEYTDRTVFSSKKAGYLMYKLVENNFVSATTGNGRKREGRIPFISHSLSDVGNTLDWNNFDVNVLSDLQKLAVVGGVDFDLDGFDEVEDELVFSVHEDQLGTDRSATVRFSLGLGNMANPEYVRDMQKEKTVANVWGRGDRDARDYVTRTGDNYSVTNDIESHVEASLHSTTDGYNSFGDQRLKGTKALDELTFEVLQTPATKYAKHYFLGDLVTGEYEEITRTLKVVSVGIEFQNHKEIISVGLDDLNA